MSANDRGEGSDVRTGAPRPVVVFGGPGGGAIVAQTLNAIAAEGGDLRLAGFLNDVLPAGAMIEGAPVLGGFDDWVDQTPDAGFIAPLHKAKEMRARAHRIRTLGIPAERWISVVDPRALMPQEFELGAGCFVAPFAVIGPAARIGANVTIRSGANVSHDTRLSDHVYVGPNAVVCGRAELAEGVHVAPGALVREDCRIGRYAVIGLGAVVNKDLPDFAIAAGNPSRIIGSVLTADETAAGGL